MENRSAVETSIVAAHVVRLAVPTPTLPPAFETNTYVIFNGDKAILVDAGSDHPDILAELVHTIGRLGIRQVEALLATHYHRDHTHGLPYLQRHYRAPILIHPADQTQLQHEFAAIGQTEAAQFIQAMPRAWDLAGLRVDIRHAPGHTHGHVHIIIAADDVILVGDHLSGDGSVWIGPPDGHMSDYYTALNAIVDSGMTVAGPGHGSVLLDAPAAARRIRQRRDRREQDMIDLLHGAALTIDELTNQLYAGVVPEEAMWVARRTVRAHVLHMLADHRVRRTYTGAHAGFRYASTNDSLEGTVQ